MTVNKLKLLIAPWLVAAAVAGGVVAANRGEARTDPPPKPAAAASPGKAAGVKWTAPTVLEQSGWLAGSVAFTRDGRTLIVGGTGCVRSYDVETLRENWTRRVKGDAQDFAAVDVSFDNQRIAATHANGVQFLDVQSGGNSNHIEVEGSKPTAVKWFPDGEQLPTTPPHVPRRLVFNVDRGYCVTSWLHHGGIMHGMGTINLNMTPDGTPRRPAGEVPLAVDPKGKRVVVTGPIDPKTGKHVLWAWSAGSGEANRVMEGHAATVISAAWSADGTTIVTGDADGTVIVWDAGTFKEKFRRKFEHRVVGVAATADGKRLAAAVIHQTHMRGAGRGSHAQQVVVFDAANTATVLTAGDRRSADLFEGVGSVAFSPDGKSLAAAFCNFKHLSLLGRLVGKVWVWRVDEPPAKPAPAATTGWKEVEVLTLHDGPVDSAAFAPDGKSFVSGGADGKLLIWDAVNRTPQELGAVIPAGKRTAVAFQADGRRVAATRDKVVGLFDVIARQAVAPNPQWPGGQAIAFSPDGTWVAIHDGKYPVIYGVKAGLLSGALKPMAERPADDSPAALAWSPDSSRVAIPFHDPNGRLFGIDVCTIRESEVKPLTGHGEKVTAIAWSPDGTRIATGGRDGVVIVWAAAARKELRRLFPGGKVRPGEVAALAWSPDGVELAAGVNGGSDRHPHRVHIFDLPEPIGPLVTGRSLPVGTPVREVAYSPDGRMLVAAHGIDRSALKPNMTRFEKEAAGGVTVWRRE